MRITKNHIAIVSMFLILTVLLTGKTSAIDFNGVSLGPTIVNQELKPGEQVEVAYTIQNKSNDTYRIEPYAQDYNVENGTWNPVENPDPTWSPMTWMQLVSSPQSLGPKSEGVIKVIYNVPANAEVGEHETYFSVRFVPAKSGSEQNVTVASEIRSIVYITVEDSKGVFKRNQAWDASNLGCNFWQFGKPEIGITALNTGNVHLETQGSIEIKDLLRNQKVNLDIPLVNILPGVQKDIRVPWSDAPFFGYYEVVMKYGYSSDSIKQHTFRFVTIPLTSFIGLLVVIGGLTTAIILYIRRLKRRLASYERNYPPTLVPAESALHLKGGEENEESYNA